MSILNPDAGWPDIDGINTNERLLGGVNGPLNRAPSQLTARTKKLHDDLAALGADLAGPEGAAQVGFTQSSGALTQTLAAKLRAGAINLSSYADLNSAIAAASGKVLIVDRNEDVIANTTLPNNVTLVYGGGTLMVKAGVTFTLAGTYCSFGNQLIAREDYTAQVPGIFTSDDSVGNAPDVQGQTRLSFDPKYSIGTTFPTTSAMTFSTGHQPLVQEKGRMFVKVRYTGALAQITMQLTNGVSTVIAEKSEQLAGSAGGTFENWRTQVFEGDGVSKEVILYADNLNLETVGAASHCRFIFNNSTAFRVANFVIEDIKYGFINPDHVHETDTRARYYKAYSIREGYPSGLWYNAPDLSYFKVGVDRAKAMGCSGLRITLPYKSLVDENGLYIQSQAAKFDAALAYASQAGMAVIASINHCFSWTPTTTPIAPHQIVYPNEIDDPENLPGLFMRAGRAVAYLEAHPAVVQVELQNEVNLFFLSGERALPVYWQNLRNYLLGLNTAVRANCKKTISFSTSSTGAARNIIGALTYFGIDLMDCHVYDDQMLRFLFPNADTISLEQDTRAHLAQAQQICQAYGPWTSYVTPGQGSYNPDFAAAYVEAKRGMNLLSLAPKSEVYAAAATSLPYVRAETRQVLNSNPVAGGYAGWVRVGAAWKQFGLIEA